jgi:hypothetical protein
MNVRNFSLDFLQPGSSSRGPAAPSSSAAPPDDEWAEAIRYYGQPVLRTLQAGGAKRVKELFEATKTALPAPTLELNQFLNVVWRMIDRRQLAVVERAETLAECSVGLPILKK